MKYHFNEKYKETQNRKKKKKNNNKNRFKTNKLFLYINLKSFGLFNPFI